MSSTALKVVAVVAVLLALILAFIGFQVSKNYASKADQAAQQMRQQKVEQYLAVVAVKPLAAYAPIERDSVAMVPMSVQVPSAYDSLDAVVGKVPLVDVDIGAPVTPRYFKEGNVLARVIPVGHQAVSVEINDVVAVGGFVRPGDVVDLLLFLRASNASANAQPQSRILLEAVRVLAYEERIIDRPEGIREDQRSQQQQRRSRTAVLAIPEADTTKLMLGISLGDIRLALHGQSPSSEAVTISETAAQEATPGRTPRREKAISLAELTRLSGGAAAAPRASVEVIRGSRRETVSTP